MIVSRLEIAEVSPSMVGRMVDLSKWSREYVSDFAVSNRKVFCAYESGIVSISLYESSYGIDGRSRKFVHGKESPPSRSCLSRPEDEYFSQISYDRRRDLFLVVEETHEHIIVYSHNEKNGRFVEVNKYRLIPQKGPSDCNNSFSSLTLDERRQLLVTSIVGSGVGERSGEVYLVRNYAEKTPEIEMILKHEGTSPREGVGKAIFSKTRPTQIIFSSVDSKGENWFRFFIFDFSEEVRRIVVTSQVRHKRRIRDLKSYKKLEGEEIVIACSNDENLTISKFSDGKLIHQHNFDEMLCSTLICTRKFLLVIGNWGSIFSMNLESFESQRLIKKDARNCTTHVGKACFIGESNYFFATQGDSRIRLFRVDLERGEKRWIESFDSMFTEEYDVDLKERVEFLRDGQNFEIFQITIFRVLFVTGITSNIVIPKIFFSI